MRALILSALLLSGCASFTETAKRHPYVTGFVVTSLALSGAKALQNHHGSLRPTDIETPTVDCSVTSCR